MLEMSELAEAGRNRAREENIEEKKLKEEGKKEEMKIKISGFLLFLFFLHFSIFFAACTYEKINLLGVDINIGKAGEVELEIKPTTGEKELTIDLDRAIYDQTLQQSLQAAYNLAKQKAKNSCPVVLTFKSFSQSLSGPSGGLPIALALYKSFSNDKIELSNYAITGAINEFGNVLPVGGVLEKAEVADKKKKKMILPITDRFDYILMKFFYPNLNVFYVKNFDEAISVIKGNSKGSNPGEILFRLPPTLTIEKNSSFVYDFNLYYDQLKNDYTETLKRLNGKIPNDAYSYYSEIIYLSEREKSKGYFYTASNFLFTNIVELLAIDAMINNRNVKAEAESCLAKVKSENVSINVNNFELVGGAKFRIKRAENRLATQQNENTRSAKAYKEKANGEALEWCKFASLLIEKAKKIEGKEINQSALKDYVLSKIFSVNENILNEEGKEFFKAAMQSSAQQDYLTASVFLAYLDSTYSFANYEIRDFKSFWGKVFGSQAEYYFYTNMPQGNIMKLSLNFEEIYNVATKGTEEKSKINETILNETKKETEKKAETEKEIKINKTESINETWKKQEISIEKSEKEKIKNTLEQFLLVFIILAILAVFAWFLANLGKKEKKGRRYKYGGRKSYKSLE